MMKQSGLTLNGLAAWVAVMFFLSSAVTVAGEQAKAGPGGAGAATAEEKRPPVETLWGVLERTAKESACARITDSLDETYYVLRTQQAVRACRTMFGKKVVLKGVVVERSGDPAYFFQLESIRPWERKSAKKPRFPDHRLKKSPVQSPAGPGVGRTSPASPSADEKKGAKDTGKAPKSGKSKSASPAGANAGRKA